MNKSSQNNQYRQRLQNINLDNALRYIGACSVGIWKGVDKNERGVFYRHTEVIRQVEKVSEYYNLSLLSYLASEVIANSRNRHWSFDLYDFNEGIRFINSDRRRERSEFVSDPIFQGIQLIASQIFAQLPLAEQTPIFNKFSRYELMFDDLPKQQTSASLRQVSSHFTELTQGTTFREFMMAGFAFFALALETRGQVTNPSMEPVRIGESLINNDTISRFLNIVSLDPEAFKQRMNRRVSETLHWPTLLNPLLRYPVVKWNNSYFTPVPQLILTRCTQGIYEDLRDNLEDNQKENFLRGFGRIFEKYVELILSRTSQSIIIWPEQDYENKSLKSSDIIVLSGEDLILIECKTSSMNKQVKTWMSKERYNNELTKVIDGVETIIRSVKHLREGKLIIDQINTGNIKRWLGIVVTLDEYLLNLPPAIDIVASNNKEIGRFGTLPFKEYFFSQCRERLTRSKFVSPEELGTVLLENEIRIISIDEFEQLLGAMMVEHISLYDALSGPLKFASHPFLKEHFDKIWQSIRPG